MNYQQSTKEELVKFISDRGLKVDSTARSNRGPLRRDYIRALQHADKSPRFDFMSLLPELRLLIYEHLLTLLPSGSGSKHEACWPAILLSCKAVNKEATKLLYNNTVQTNMISTRMWGGDTKSKLTHIRHSPWPKFLRRIRHLSVQLCTFGDFVAMQNRLYKLCSVLHGKHTLQTLHLNFARVREDDPHLDVLLLPDPGRMYYPLRLLGPGVKVTVEDVDAAHAQYAATTVNEKLGREHVPWSGVEPGFRAVSSWLQKERARYERDHGEGRYHDGDEIREIGAVEE